MDISERTLQLKTDIDEVYEAGKKAEHNEFWNDIGTRADYRFAGTAWNKNTFKPTQNFEVGNRGFYYHNWQGQAYDLATQLEELGVTMTLDDGADVQTFYYAWFTRLPELDFSLCSGQFDRVFYAMSRLVTIDNIILPPEGKITSFNTPFYNCTNLKTITFAGVIDKSISFSDSPLSVVSMKSIISCLKDYSGTDGEYSYTVTFKTSAFNVLESEGSTAEYNGEACTWAELIDNKKWNLVKG